MRGASPHAQPQSYDWSAFPKGLAGVFCLAGFVMACSFTGFGAYLRSLGFLLHIGIVSNVVVWALPGQVVFLSAWSAGSGLLITSLAVTLTAVRLLPMSMLVLSAARLDRAPRWPEFLLAHFIAVTLWIIANRRLHTLAREARVPWLIGLGCGMMVVMSGFTAVGYFLAEELPPSLAATLVFFTPAFFLFSLFGGARYRFDYLAIVLGALSGGLSSFYAPKFDLLIGGLVGGSLAYVIARPGRRGMV